MIETDLAEGRLRALPLAHGRERIINANLVLADRENAGPGTRRLVELISEECAHAQG